MNIVNYFRNFFNRIRKGNNPMLLDLPKELYSKLIDEKKISSILENIPEHFTDLEKAYYIYIELGKILNENPKFVFGDRECKREHYNDEIDEKYLGICKSISELYVSVLAKIGIQADLVKENPNSPISHIDTVLKIDGKNYIANLIGDLGRIKTGSRINYFGYNLARENGNSAKGKANREYLVRLEKYYGKMDYLRRRDIEQFDKKLGYSFFVPQFTREDERGIYTEDTFELLKRDFDNP